MQNMTSKWEVWFCLFLWNDQINDKQITASCLYLSFTQHREYQWWHNASEIKKYLLIYYWKILIILQLRWVFLNYSVIHIAYVGNESTVQRRSTLYGQNILLLRLKDFNILKGKHFDETGTLLSSLSPSSWDQSDKWITYHSLLNIRSIYRNLNVSVEERVGLDLRMWQKKTT